MHNQSILRNLGQSNIQLTPIGLGCWQFSQGNGWIGKYWSNLSDPEIQDIVRTSVEGGINWFDTAEVYGWGRSEQALDNALSHLESDEQKKIHIATKWWPLFRTSQSITNTIDQRIESLGGRTIDLYQIHQPFSLSSIPKQMSAMAELVHKGKIKAVGVSNFNAKQMRRAHEVCSQYGIPLASNQVKYNLLDRRVEHNGIINTAKALGITIIAYSPLEQGLLTGKYHHNPSLIQSSKGPRKYMSKFKPSGLSKSKPIIEELERIAVNYEASPAEVALNWLIHYQGTTVSAIPGASKIKHVEENIHAMKFQLTSEELQRLSNVSKQY